MIVMILKQFIQLNWSNTTCNRKFFEEHAHLIIIATNFKF